MNDQKLGIVILNWNSLEDTLRCLQSLSAADYPPHSIDLVVVDNGSTIDPGAEIRTRAPRADFLRLTTNVGFAAACNIGARRCLARGADYVLFLNNDTTLSPEVLPRLVGAFAEYAKLGIVAPLIVEMDDPSVIDFAGARINFSLGTFQHNTRSVAGPMIVATDYVTGACMMLSRQTMEKIGFFDETLFTYFEDVDLSLRAKQAGLRIALVPGARILHKGSASTRRTLKQGTTSPLKHYLIARNRTLVVRRYGSFLARLLYFALATPVRLAFYTCAFALKFRWKKLRAFWSGTMDGIRNKSGLPPTILFN